VVAGVSAAVLYGLLRGRTVEPPLLRADARELRRTVVTPHLEEQIVPGRNVLWCSSFQLAWNEGCRNASGDIRLDAEPPMVQALNRKTASEADLAPGSYVAIFGRFDRDTVGNIRQELAQKFPGQASPELLDMVARKAGMNGAPGPRMVYAYLFRDLPFENQFERLKQPLLFATTQVASFGVSLKTPERFEVAQQVLVLDYQSGDDFILVLRPKEEGERILLAKVVPAETMERTISSIRKRIAERREGEQSESLAGNEVLVVPILNFDVWREYGELEGKRITTPGQLEDMVIAWALQRIRFRLDQRGAVLLSESWFAESAGAPAAPKPRQFIFDKPFLILMERTGAAQPYFALWVDNAELLAPYQ
jgi:hypothetical protein